MTVEGPAALSPASSVAARSAWIVPAAAGIFLGAVVFDAVPAAAATLGPEWVALAAAGFALMLLSGKAARGKLGGAASVGTAGVWLHSTLEGFSAGAGMAFGMGGGAWLALGVLVHLVPESVALFGLATGAGVSTGRALARCAVTWLLVVAGFVAAQAGPALPAELLGAAMALAAGTFSFLAWALWRSREVSSRMPLLVAMLGFVWVAASHL
ncbi:MAG TPA: hypothetical protein VHJ78_01575 [Actinomycetota bacterium]|nr:hypothetical protein [Actinomycetota bacterium]